MKRVFALAALLVLAAFAAQAGLISISGSRATASQGGGGGGGGGATVTGLEGLVPGVMLGKDMAAGSSTVGYHYSKHTAWAYDESNDRLYQVGGDYLKADTGGTPSGAGESYRQDMHSMDLATAFALANLADTSSGWAVAQGYCAEAVAGGVEPKSSDYSGWVRDTTHNLFWRIPGISVSPVGATCSGETTDGGDNTSFKANHIMSWNRGAALGSRWHDYGLDTAKISAESLWDSVYDSTTDKIVRAQINGGGTTQLDVLNVATTISMGSIQWTQHIDLGNDGSGDAIAGWTSKLAIDIPGRWIYLLSFRSFPAWSETHAYTVGDMVSPGDTRYVYRNTTAGTSGANKPSFCNTLGCTTSDGSAVWTSQDPQTLTNRKTKLFRVNVDDLVAGTKTIQDLGLTPVPQATQQQVNGLIAWDSVSRRLVMYEHIGLNVTPKLLYYNPITAQWDDIPYVISNSTKKAHARHAFNFVAAHNVIFLGGDQTEEAELSNGAAGQLWVHEYQYPQPAYLTAMTAGQVKMLVPASGSATPLAATPTEWKQSLGGVSSGGTGSDGRNFVAAWGTSALDPRTKIMYLIGGGHGDSSNNGVYASDLQTGAWTRTDGSALAATIPSSDTYSDGRPTSVHPYDGWEYCDGKLWRSRGSQFSPGGSQTSIFWEYNLSTATWTNHGSVTGFDGGTLGDNLVCDPQRRKLIDMQVDHMKYRVWDIATNNWTASVVVAGDGNTGSNFGWSEDQTNSAFDVKRSRILTLSPTVMGRTDWDGSALDIVGTVGSGSEFTNMMASGDTPSLTYDEDLDCFWAVPIGNGASGGATKIYKIDAATYAVTAYALTYLGGESAPVNGSAFLDLPSGGFGNLQNIRGWNALAFTARVDKGVYIIKKPNVGQYTLWQ